MASNATAGFGSDLAWSATQNGTFVNVAQTVDLEGPSPEIGDIEITNNDSPDNTREYMPGLIEPGEQEFQVVYTKAQCATLYGMFGNGITYWWKLIYPDGSYWKYPGYLKKFGTEAETEDSKIMNTIAFKLTGKPAFTAGS